jgi:hypothetical protein
MRQLHKIEICLAIFFILIVQYLGPVFTGDTIAFTVNINTIDLLGFNEKNGFLYQFLLYIFSDRLVLLLQSIVMIIAIKTLSSRVCSLINNQFTQYLITIFLYANPYFIDWSRTLLPDVLNLAISIVFFVAYFREKKSNQSSYVFLLSLAMLVFSLRFITGIFLLILIMMKIVYCFVTSKTNRKNSTKILVFSSILLTLFLFVTANYASQPRLVQMYREHRVAVFGKEDEKFKDFYYENGMPACKKLEEIWLDSENLIEWGTFMQVGMKKECSDTYDYINQGKISPWSYVKDSDSRIYFVKRLARGMFPEIAPRTASGDLRIAYRISNVFLSLGLCLMLIRRGRYFFHWIKFTAVLSVIGCHSLLAIYVDGKEPARHLLPFSFIFWFLPMLSLSRRRIPNQESDLSD